MNRVKKDDTTWRHGVTPDQLVTIQDLQLFQEELLKGIQQLLSQMVSGKDARPARWLKTYQVQKLLNCSVGTLLTLRSNGTLPFTKIGGTIFYNADDINRVLQEGCSLNGKKISFSTNAKMT